MSALHPWQIALIDDTGQLAGSDLDALANALNTQISKHFGPVWGAYGTVTVATERTRPAHAWPIHIQTSLNQPGALGYHADQQNQPVAYVELTSDYTITVSHEALEALADPWGNRMHPPAALPAGLNPAQVGLTEGATVRYLVEVSDPCEQTSYTIDGVAVSDFLRPRWYGSQTGPWSYAGGCTQPLQVADGGYCSFARTDDNWFQCFNEGGSLSVSNLGKFSRGEGAWTLREWADSKAREHRASNG